METKYGALKSSSSIPHPQFLNHSIFCEATQSTPFVCLSGLFRDVIMINWFQRWGNEDEEMRAIRINSENSKLFSKEGETKICCTKWFLKIILKYGNKIWRPQILTLKSSSSIPQLLNILWSNTINAVCLFVRFIPWYYYDKLVSKMRKWGWGNEDNKNQ